MLPVRDAGVRADRDVLGRLERGAPTEAPEVIVLANGEARVDGVPVVRVPRELPEPEVLTEHLGLRAGLCPQLRDERRRSDQRVTAEAHRRRLVAEVHLVGPEVKQLVLHDRATDAPTGLQALI